MRHRKSGGKLSRPTQARIALLRSLVSALFLHQRIETTLAKAKEARRLAEKIITMAKHNDLHHRRLVLKIIPDKKIVKKVFDTVAPKYQDRNSGYTRIIRCGTRRGDSAQLVILELVK